MTLFKKGAEASLFLADWNGRKVVIKARLPKRYRPAELDAKIRSYRTAHEPQLMHKAKKAGVPTPTIFLVDMKNASITMEFVEGKQVKQVLPHASPKERQELCVKIGTLIGKLHKHGVIHGDLTTSNMILNGEGKIFLVDFGLGEKNAEIEARGVDLHLMKRALQSTHYETAAECFKHVQKGYAAILGREDAEKVFEKIREIERRGRYVDESKQAEFPLKGRVVFFATGNIHKFNEARSILTRLDIAVGMLRMKDVEIQSNSLMEIAQTSAREVFKRCRLPVIVEDAGLFIDALKGFPGPYAAYAYQTIGNAGLLKLMKKVENREATFKSAIAYCDSLDDPLCFEGKAAGEITKEERVGNGKSGFGFDPIFQPSGSAKTFAEMTLEQKNGFSHRAMAVRKFAEWYKKLQ